MKSAVNALGKPNKTGDVELAMEAALKLLKVCNNVFYVQWID